MPIRDGHQSAQVCWRLRLDTHYGSRCERARRNGFVNPQDPVVVGFAVDHDLDPSDLRSLDSIHLAAAASLGDDLAAVVTYDDRMLAAAISLGFPTASPS